MRRSKSTRSPSTEKRAGTSRRERRPWGGYGRGYEDPEALIRAIHHPAHALAARLQYEGGTRAEGSGFPRSPYSKHVFTAANMVGLGQDPFFTNRTVGIIRTTEKGGATNVHYITEPTFLQLEKYLQEHHVLCGNYEDYLAAVNTAARNTKQFIQGRGTHGLKHSFAIEFLRDAAREGKGLRETLIEISIRCSHRRGDVAPTYYTGRR